MNTELLLVSAAYSYGYGLGFEMSKCAPDVRGPCEARFIRAAKECFTSIQSSLSVDKFAKVLAQVVQARLLESKGQEREEGTALASGLAMFVGVTMSVYPRTLSQMDSSAPLVAGGVALLQRLCPEPLPAEWWVATCTEADVTSANLGQVMYFFANCAKLLGEALGSASWLSPVVTHSLHLCKVNASAGLSGHPTMCWLSVYSALALLMAVTRVESHAAAMLESDVIEALDYACINEFTYNHASVSANAAGALVALVGRNEGGKTLSRSAVSAVLSALDVCFDETNLRYSYSCIRILADLRRIATMTISDANKKVMLQHEKLLETLTTALLLDEDHPRRGQEVRFLTEIVDDFRQFVDEIWRF